MALTTHQSMFSTNIYPFEEQHSSTDTYQCHQSQCELKVGSLGQNGLKRSHVRLASDPAACAKQSDSTENIVSNNVKKNGCALAIHKVGGEAINPSCVNVGSPELTLMFW